MSLGDTLDPPLRDWLSQLAADMTYSGFFGARLDELNSGEFPSRDRGDGGVVVRWGPRVVPFGNVRRLYDDDVRSFVGWTAGRLGGVLRGFNELDPNAGGGRAPPRIDAELARRMPEASLPAPSDLRTVVAGITRPLAALALDGPTLRRLCAGIDVPRPPVRGNLATEPRLSGPDGVIRWSRASLVSDAEMTALGVETANRAYTLLLGLAEGRLGAAPGPDRLEIEAISPGLLPD
jgi:hypothetical protein